MGRVRVSRLLGARLGYTAGCSAAAAGVWLVLGLGFALMVVGAVAAASFLLLMDVDDEEERRG